MTFRTVDLPESGVANVLCDFLLLGKREETVALDTQDKCWLLDERQGLRDAGRPIPRYIVSIELSGYCYITVAVKSFYKFLS